MEKLLTNVRVERVNIANYAGKRVQRYTPKADLSAIPVTTLSRRLYVTVAEGQKIDYYSNI